MARLRAALEGAVDVGRPEAAEVLASLMCPLLASAARGPHIALRHPGRAVTNRYRGEPGFEAASAGAGIGGRWSPSHDAEPAGGHVLAVADDDPVRVIWACHSARNARSPRGCGRRSSTTSRSARRTARRRAAAAAPARRRPAGPGWRRRSAT